MIWIIQKAPWLVEPWSVNIWFELYNLSQIVNSILTFFFVPTLCARRYTQVSKSLVQLIRGINGLSRAFPKHKAIWS